MRLSSALAAILFLTATASSFAQVFDVPEVSYPELAGQAAAPEGFVPQGWMLERLIVGDLNKDAMDDAVLVLRLADPSNILKTDWAPDQPVDTNPRILAVALADEQSGYNLAVQNHELIWRLTSPTESDPLSEAGGVSIDRGSLKVDLYYFSSAGGSDMGVISYRFRHENGDFRLIGYDRENTHRMSGEVTETSINLLTRKVIIKTGSIENDEVKTTTRKLKAGQPVTIADVGDGALYDPLAKN